MNCKAMLGRAIRKPRSTRHSRSSRRCSTSSSKFDRLQPRDVLHVSGNRLSPFTFFPDLAEFLPRGI